MAPKYEVDLVNHDIRDAKNKKLPETKTVTVEADDSGAAMIAALELTRYEAVAARAIE